MPIKPTMRRRLTRWAGLAIALGLASLIGIDQLYQPGRFPFRHIDLAVRQQSGALAVDRAALGQAFDGVIGGNYFAVDLSRRARLVEQVPGVHRATLRRRWPGILQVRVQPVLPQAVWNGSQCLHTDGGPHTCPESVHAGLAQLYGPADLLPRVWQHYVQWRDLLSRQGFRLHALQLDEQGLWRLLVAGKNVGQPVQILLPGSQADALLLRFTRAAGKHLASEIERMQRVDLRYANGFAVEWRSRPLVSAKQP